MELDEPFDDGVRREVAEETGMLIAVNRFAGVYKKLARGIVALVFRGYPGGQPDPSHGRGLRSPLDNS